MTSFLFPGLLWGLLLLALPILIHLINLLRHRRVQWAAMEFLLQSQRKNSTWIRLKELLLLLLRLAAVAGVVLMLAQPVLRNRWAELFGGTRTHHIVLLDDSFSTSDRWGETTALDEAKQFLNRLATKAARQGQSQTFTLLRFSRCGQGGQGTQPDMLAETVGSDFHVRMADMVSNWQPSATAVGPAEGLDALRSLLTEAADEGRILYLVSDLRAREWLDPSAQAKQLSELQAANVQLRLIHTVDAARPNLAITALTPVDGIRAAGVPMFMEVAVRNFSTAPAQNVTILLEEDGEARPSIVLDSLGPNQIETRRFPVSFPVAGEHRVSARIEGDNVEADNARFAVVQVPVSIPTLIIDGGEAQIDGQLLSVALNPGNPVRTGLTPRVETPSYLNTHELDDIRTVILCNFKRLDASAVEKLEQFVRRGGGLAIFAGEESDPRFLTDVLYREGEGVFPAPVLLSTDMLVDRSEPVPDLVVAEHPIFRVFSGERNSFLGMVKVDRYLATQPGWKPAQDSPVQLIAKLRNGAPLVLDAPFGAGRVVTFLTTAGPAWNNWARNPSYVVAMLELQSHLLRGGWADETRLVGTPLAIELENARHQPKVRFSLPTTGDTAANAAGAEVPIDATLGTAASVATLSETAQPGIYSARLTTVEGAEELRRYAYNVQPEEGDLATVTSEHLGTVLRGTKYEYQPASALQDTGSGELQGAQLGDALLALLILLLVGEQALAWSASYHPPTKEGKSS